MAEEVAKEYVGKIFFGWVDGNLNIERKKLLGIEHNKYYLIFSGFLLVFY